MIIKRYPYILLAALIALTLGSCMKEDSNAPLDAAVEQVTREQYYIREYLRTNRQDSGLIVHPSGMCYKIIEHGNSRDFITAENVPVVVFERSVFPTGKILESSLGLPTSFDGRKLKDHILGWQIGLPIVSKGGRIIMYIPSALGFGITGIPGIIPPNTILICDVTLVNFK